MSRAIVGRSVLCSGYWLLMLAITSLWSENGGSHRHSAIVVDATSEGMRVTHL